MGPRKRPANTWRSANPDDLFTFPPDLRMYSKRFGRAACPGPSVETEDENTTAGQVRVLLAWAEDGRRDVPTSRGHAAESRRSHNQGEFRRPGSPSGGARQFAWQTGFRASDSRKRKEACSSRHPTNTGRTPTSRPAADVFVERDLAVAHLAHRASRVRGRQRRSKRDRIFAMKQMVRPVGFFAPGGRH